MSGHRVGIPGQAPFVGRARELALAGVVLDDARSGTGRAVVLSGSPGIGKTRLASQIVDAAVAQGFRSLHATAHALEADLSFAPVLALLGPVVRDMDDASRRRVAEALPDLARLFPSLGARAPEPLADPSLERSRIVAAVDGLVEHLTTTRPLIVTLDDIQWADPASLQLLHVVARQLDERPLVLLLTRRSTGEPVAPVDELLRSLRRRGAIDELDLEPLSSDDSTTLVRGLLGERVPAELLALVERRAAGIPLFVEVLVRELADAGRLSPTALGWALRPGDDDVIPRVVHDAVADRLERLTPDEREVLALLALSGEPLGAADLVAAAHGASAGIEGAVASLRLASLVTPAGTTGSRRRGPEPVQVAHPLIADVVRDRLDEAAARTHHARLLDAARADVAADPRRLARHAEGAADLVPDADALALLHAAAALAEELGAADEAAHHLVAALDRLPATAAPGERAALLRRLGDARAHAGDPVGAAGHWVEALGLLGDDAAPAARATLHHAIADEAWTRGDRREAEAHLAAGLALVDGAIGAPVDEPVGNTDRPVMRQDDEVDDARAALLLLSARILERDADREGLEGVLEQLRAMTARDHRHTLVAHVHLLESGLAFDAGDLAGAFAAAEAALAAATAADDAELRLRAHDALAILAAEQPDHRRARSVLEPGIALARELGAVTTEMRTFGVLSVAAFMAGDWREAEIALARSMALARRTDNPRGMTRTLCVRVFLLAFRNRFDEGAAALAEARTIAQGLGDRHLLGSVDGAEAYLVLERGDAARALELRPALEVPGALYQRRLAAAAEIEVRFGSPEEALALAGRIRAIDATDATAMLADHAEAQALVAMGRTEDARVAAARAHATALAIDAGWEAVRIGLVLGDLTGDVALLQECLERFEALGTPRWADRTRAALRHHGVRLAPPRPAHEPAVLSRRELEVARLAAEGLTNAQIAGRLVISKHTAGSHLQRIYQRLDVNSRAALTRRLAELDLL